VELQLETTERLPPAPTSALDAMDALRSGPWVQRGKRRCDRGDKRPRDGLCGLTDSIGPLVIE
jgi:hypothetical protein